MLLHNGELHEATDRTLSAGQVGFLNGWGVFSTLRVAGGVLFAFERHWNRMAKDAERMHVPFPTDSEKFRTDLLRLVQANHANNATLRVAVIRNRGGLFEAPDVRDCDVVAFTADLTNWPPSARLSLKPNARHAANEFSGAKINSWAQNLTWYEEAHQRGFDEVVLLNERGEVSECTSANIFAISGDEVFTPPLTSGCLPGVTREILLEEIHYPGLRIEERVLLPNDLEEADAVFITSTTRDLSPVHLVEGLRIKNAAGLVEALREEFVKFREAYVENPAATAVV